VLEVEDDGGSMVDVVLEENGSKEVVVVVGVMDALVVDNEGTVLMVVGIVTVIDEETRVVGVALKDI
jgi:hypothetical protein